MLTAKQEKFALAVASGMTQADGYRKAYSAKNMKPATVQKRASELMDNGAVAGRVANLRQSVQQKAIDLAGLNKAWVLTRLAKVVDLGMATAPVLNRQGEEVGRVAENLAAANKALELIGKDIGMFTDRLAIGGDPELPPISIEEGARRIAFIFARAMHEKRRREALQREALEPIFRTAPTLK